MIGCVSIVRRDAALVLNENIFYVMKQRLRAIEIVEYEDATLRNDYREYSNYFGGREYIVVANIPCHVFCDTDLFIKDPIFTEGQPRRIRLVDTSEACSPDITSEGWGTVRLSLSNEYSVFDFDIQGVYFARHFHCNVLSYDLINNCKKADTDKDIHFKDDKRKRLCFGSKGAVNLLSPDENRFTILPLRPERQLQCTDAYPCLIHVPGTESEEGHCTNRDEYEVDSEDLTTDDS